MMPHFLCKPTNQQKRISLTLLILVFTFIGSLKPQPTLAAYTRTPKACHMCETVLPDSTATPTPDACGIDCLDTTNIPTQQADFETPPAQRTNPAVISVVFYWMEGCPHCDEVMAATLPALEQTYGPLLDIQKIELISVEDVDRLYELGKKFGLDKEKTRVPFVVFDDKALTGKEEINKTLPGLIQNHFEDTDSDLSIPKAEPTKKLNLSTPLIITVVFLIGSIIGVLYKKGFLLKSNE